MHRNQMPVRYKESVSSTCQYHI